MTHGEKMLCWPLFGKGLEQLGQAGQPCLWDLPAPASDQLLVRIEAVGLCFSDIKLIRAGEEHPRVHSTDLKRQPVIPGHEAVMTVVQTGSETLAAEYPVGSRYIIQADIYVDGVGFAYGYAINGGMAQYSIIDQRVLNGDEGSYLLPLAEHVPAAVAALIEPWTCVIASYMIELRRQIQPAGRLLVAMMPDEQAVFSLSRQAVSSEGGPLQVDCLNLNRETINHLKRALPQAEFNHLTQMPDKPTYDDIVCCGIDEPAMVRSLSRAGLTGAAISLVGVAADGDWSFDVGSIHYRGWYYQGDESRDIASAYGRNVRSRLRSGGTCWLVGGAGAMGQMHTQLAVENEDGPERVLVTDLDDDRIARTAAILADSVQRRGVQFETMNPNNFPSEEAFMQAVGEFAPDGFDDIVVLVPVAKVIKSAARLLARDGLMNIFAGIPTGQETSLDIDAIVRRGVRFIGSSGSRTHHLRHTLNLVETGQLRPVTALAAVGGMRALWEGLEGVAAGRFPGKTVIFPQCEHLPLTPVEQLPELGPAIADSLTGEDMEYNMATETAVMQVFGSGTTGNRQGKSKNQPGDRPTRN